MTHRNSIVSLIGIAAIALASTAQAQEQVVAIGHTGPLSGRTRSRARTTKTVCAWRSKNSTPKKLVVGGKTLKFELQSEDDQCDAKAGVNVAQKLVDSKVKYVMGPYCSGVAIPASRVYSEGGAMLSTVGTNPEGHPGRLQKPATASSPATTRSAPAWPCTPPRS